MGSRPFLYPPFLADIVQAFRSCRRSFKSRRGAEWNSVRDFGGRTSDACCCDVGSSAIRATVGQGRDRRLGAKAWRHSDGITPHDCISILNIPLLRLCSISSDTLCKRPYSIQLDTFGNFGTILCYSRNLELWSDVNNKQVCKWNNQNEPCLMIAHHGRTALAYYLRWLYVLVLLWECVLALLRRFEVKVERYVHRILLQGLMRCMLCPTDLRSQGICS